MPALEKIEAPRSNTFAESPAALIDSNRASSSIHGGMELSAAGLNGRLPQLVISYDKVSPRSPDSPIGGAADSRQLTGAYQARSKDEIYLDQRTIHEKDFSTHIQNYSDPKERFAIRVSKNGDFDINYANGKTFKLTHDGDGNVKGVSTGPEPENNFTVFVSKDKRTEKYVYADKSEITFNTDGKGNTASVIGTGPGKFHNFEMGADNKVHYLDRHTAAYDPKGENVLKAVIEALGSSVHLRINRSRANLALLDRDD